MNFRKISCALGLGLLLGGVTQADTTYNITFTDNSANKYFSNGNGTFSINSADQLTSFDVSLNVLQPYTFEGSHVTTGEVLNFDSTNFSPPVTYNPVTNAFAETGTVDNSFFVYTFPGGGTTDGLFLGLDNNTSATSGGLILNGYTIDLVSGEFFSGYVDTGTWTVSASPEPATTGLLLSGLLLGGALLRRRKRA
jgi:hypothetical protein